MRWFVLVLMLCSMELSAFSKVAAEKRDGDETEKISKENKEEGDVQPVLKPHRTIIINVVGEGVAPENSTSPAQAYALAKRAAIADAYRLIAEKVQGVEIAGQDVVKNMMIKRSVVRTAVNAIVKNANIVETTFRDGLCEVEMEIKLSYDDFAH